MDFGKVGKLIAKQRNAKEMTQEQLAEKLGVDRTTISKWERAISTPDISLLQPLCKELDLTIHELLNGEKNSNAENNDINTINAIKFYNKKEKNKFIKVLAFVIAVLICFFISLLIVNNYNKFEIYKINSSQEDFIIDGYLLSNARRKIIFIKDIEYNDKYVGTDKELFAESVTVNLISNDRILYTSDNIETKEAKPLEEFLNEISVVYDTNQAEDINLEELYLNIEINHNNIISNNFIDISAETE